MITRISKIARLPAEIREQLNRRLHNGDLGKTILPWLNGLPETKKVLAEHFNGNRITHQNLSEWRHAGYLDWFLLQQRLQWFDRLGEEETELEKNQCGDAYETVGWHFLFEIGQALAALQNMKNPDARWTRLEHLSREFARLQNAYNWSRRVQLEWSKRNDNFETGEPDEPNQPIEDPHDLAEDEEDNEEYYTDDNETGEPAGAEKLDDELENNTSEPDCGSASRSNATDQPAQNPSPAATTSPTPLGALASRRPAAQPDPLAPALENASIQTAFHPIPTPAPTTPPVVYPAPYPVTPPSTTPRKHLSPVPIRGRRFTCIEG